MSIVDGLGGTDSYFGGRSPLLPEAGLKCGFVSSCLFGIDGKKDNLPRHRIRHCNGF